MSRSSTDKLVKILLGNGMGIHMYADTVAIEAVMSHPKFVKFKDDGNDNICLSIDAIAGFEVLDDRTDAQPSVQTETVSETTPST